MNYEQFKQVVTLLEKTSSVVNDASKYVNMSTFEAHNLLVSTLLETIYEPDAVAYILYEWLIGNKNELTVTSKDGTSIVYPMETLEDLYRAMELYKK